MNNPNQSNDPQDAWIKSAVDELDSGVDNMDLMEASRLRTARQMASREAQYRRDKSWYSGLGDWLNWQSGLTLACMIALVATVTFNFNLQRTEPSVEIANTTSRDKPNAGIEVIPLLTAKEDLEFYESVNFLLWLESKQGKS